MNTTVQGAPFFKSERKTTFYIHLRTTKLIHRKAFLEPKGHSSLDFGIFLKNAYGTEHFPEELVASGPDAGDDLSSLKAAEGGR